MFFKFNPLSLIDADQKLYILRLHLPGHTDRNTERKTRKVDWVTK